jgi:hypothetical protein
MLTDPGEGAELRQQAAHCRRLADTCLNGRLARILDRTADEFEEEAERIDKRPLNPSRSPVTLRFDVTHLSEDCN